MVRGLKLSVAPKQIPTEAIVSIVALRPFCLVLNTSYHDQNRSRTNIRSRVTSTLQFAIKRLKTDENIVILPSEKRRVSVVLNMTDYND